MAYDDFLDGFAKAQGVESVDILLTQHADRYRFQIRSRERAKSFIADMRSLLGFDFAGKKVLDVGCAYGSCSIEMAHQGAEVAGIEVSLKWLRLAELNAKGEADVRFLHGDASSRSALADLQPDRYDLIVLNDVLEHVYDTAGLLHNCQTLLADGGLIYFQVPNGLATESVLAEGHKKVFGISLLPPDYWHLFVGAPFKIYYRRLEYFEALFARFNLRISKWTTVNKDLRQESTRKKILADKARIAAILAEGGFPSKIHHDHLSEAVSDYFDELDLDLAGLEYSELFLKYRAPFWEGILEKASNNFELSPAKLRRHRPVTAHRVSAWLKSRFKR
jgi:SAM-dependent methyltransferase